MIARASGTCPECGKAIIARKSKIALFYDTKQWMHVSPCWRLAVEARRATSTS